MVRDTYVADLDELRLQVEVMGARVEANLERMRTVLHTGDEELAARAVGADDDIDAMNVSLTERCYELLCLEHPVASDLRLIVSVIRLIGELERIGDLSLRVTKIAPARPPLADNPTTFDALCALADEDLQLYRRAMRAWATADLPEAEELASGSAIMKQQCDRLTTELLQVTGSDSLPQALQTAEAGRALDRIGDHVAVIGARLRYLFTGDPLHLAAEVR